MGTPTVVQSRQIKSGVWLPLAGGTLAGDLTISTHNIITDTTTGTQIGTATGQKLGFFGATPVIQPVAGTDLGTVLSSLGLRAAGTAYPITTSGAVQLTGGVTISTTALTITDVNVVLSSTTGTKFGTATGQKIGFFNATPVIQQVAGTDLGTVLSNLGLRAAGTAYPITTSGAVQFTGGVTITTTNLTITDKDIALSTSTGTKIGTATGQKIGFWNATPVIQQASANQAALAAYTTGAYGLDSDAHMTALYNLVVAIRAALVATGIIKGAA